MVAKVIGTSGHDVLSRLFYTFACGLVSLIITSVCIWRWSKVEWLNFAGPFPHLWEGYTFTDFIFLFGATIFAPVSFCLLYTGLQHYRRVKSTSNSYGSYIIATLITIIVLSSILAVSIPWTAEMTCGVIFCVDTKWHTWEPSDHRPEAAIGWKIITAIPIAITSLSLIIVAIANCITHTRRRSYHHYSHCDHSLAFTSFNEPLLRRYNEADRPLNHKLQKYTPYNTHMLRMNDTYVSLSDPSDHVKSKLFHCRSIVLWLILTLMLLFCYIIATYVPNNWEYWYPSRIARNAALKVTQDPALCQDWTHYTCPEHDKAGWMRTQSIEILPKLIAKIYPSNAIFYIYLFTIITIVLIVRFIPSLQTILSKHRPIYTSRYQRIASFYTYNDILFALFTMGAVYMTWHYWFFDHNWNGYWPDVTPHISERLSRAFSFIAVFFFSLLLFPAARNSLILSLVGISWEAALVYHRVLGYLFCIFTMAHIITAYWWYGVYDKFPGDIWRIPQHLPTSTDNFTVPIMQWLIWISFITIGYMAIYEPFRRRNFGIFMMAHHFTYLTLIPAILWHATAAWEFMLPGLAVWFSDRLVRAFRSANAVHVVAAIDASIYSGERYNKPSLYSIASIDTTITTPPPIYSTLSTIKPFLAKPSHDLPGLEMSISQVSMGNRASSSSSSSVTGGSTGSSSSSDSSYDLSRYLPFNNVSGPGARIFDCGHAGQFVELHIINDNMVYFPGQYAFINIAQISLFEWHPFTIASPVHAMGKSEIIFIIKAMGKGTWTQSLYDYIAEYYHTHNVDMTKEILDVPLTIGLDGPYGQEMDFTLYDKVVLIGGGIGITPCRSIYESLLLSYLHDFKARLGSSSMVVETTKRIHLIWSARDSSLFSQMRDSLANIPCGPFTAQLYTDDPNIGRHNNNNNTDNDNTDNGNDTHSNTSHYNIESISSDNIKPLLKLISHGRPNLEEEILDVVNSPVPGSTGVLHNIATNTLSSHHTQQHIINHDKIDSSSNHHGGHDNMTQPKTLVFVCGPPGLVHTARLIASQHNYDFHSETFFL